MIFAQSPNDFGHKRKIDNFDTYNVCLAIATNIPVLLKLRLGLCSRVTYHNTTNSLLENNVNNYASFDQLSMFVN